MANLLFISFDHFRPGEIRKSHAISSLVAYLKQHAPQCGELSDVQSFDPSDPQCTPRRIVNNSNRGRRINDYDFIFLPDYAWSSRLTNPVIARLRRMGFRNKIVVGGYEVTATPNQRLQTDYPQADCFIKGYAEEAVLQIATGRVPAQDVLDIPIDPSKLVSVYLSGEMPIDDTVKMVRWETKRGCPFNCAFCEFGGGRQGKAMLIDRRRLREELALFRKTKIEKINVLDPTFNMDEGYLDLLEEIIRLKDIRFHFQTRFECIKGEDGERFLDLCAKGGNIFLEFGVQTVVETEMDTLKRRNSIPDIERVMGRLRELKIPYDTNLIYGIPGQTPKSFEESISFLERNGCPRERIRSFPLRLPKTCPIRNEDDEIVEQVDQRSGMKLVQESSSFGKFGWLAMQCSAEREHWSWCDAKNLAGIDQYLQARKHLSKIFTCFTVTIMTDGKAGGRNEKKDRLYFKFAGENGKWEYADPVDFVLKAPEFRQSIAVLILGWQSADGVFRVPDPFESDADLPDIRCKVGFWGRSYNIERVSYSTGTLQIILGRRKYNGLKKGLVGAWHMTQC